MHCRSLIEISISTPPSTSLISPETFTVRFGIRLPRMVVTDVPRRSNPQSSGNSKSLNFGPHTNAMIWEFYERRSCPDQQCIQMLAPRRIISVIDYGPSSDHRTLHNTMLWHPIILPHQQWEVLAPLKNCPLSWCRRQHLPTPARNLTHPSAQLAIARRAFIVSCITTLQHLSPLDQLPKISLALSCCSRAAAGQASEPLPRELASKETLRPKFQLSNKNPSRKS